MNARPTLQFKMRLAGHLKKTLAEIDQMSSREFSQWIAWSRYFQPLDDPWSQTGLLATAALTPHCGRSRVPSPADFVPIERGPMHRTQINDVLRQMQKDLNGQK